MSNSQNQEQEQGLSGRSCTFNIQRGRLSGDQKQTFYFELDENRRPVKVGDGTFGAVFKIADPATNDTYVVKLLYGAQIDASIKTLKVTDSIITIFQEKFKLDNQAPIIQHLHKLAAKPNAISLGEFALDLRKLTLDDDQYLYLLEQIPRTQSVVRERFIHEIESSNRIKEGLRDKNRSVNQLSGIIEVIGGTETFRLSQAYDKLHAIFQEMQIDVSDYALVMRYYEWSLKDLLEKSIEQYRIKTDNLSYLNLPANILTDLNSKHFKSKEDANAHVDSLLGIEPETKQKITQQIDHFVGYDILRVMTFQERIRTILPYLLNITQGITNLHLAEFYHHDLKPANIFVKGGANGAAVETVVGDLGFIQPTESVRATPTITANHVQTGLTPFGTRHYRSPAQKDFFDICDVAIVHRKPDNRGEKQLVLVVSDPKFRDSIIEPGDILTFSKNKSHPEYTIAKIEKAQNDINIFLEGKSDGLIEELKEDKQTQVIIYKKHRDRTDLFGLGAIAFDLLTCGWSPERFYDSIRNYDSEDNRIDKTLLDDYRQVAGFQTANPAVLPIFLPFKHESEYAPIEFVEIILKCMLYKSKGTYYDSFINQPREKKYNRAIEAVLEHLISLDANPKYAGQDRNNQLLLRTLKEKKQINPEADFQTRLNALHRLSSPEDFPRRLGESIFFFKKLVELVSRIVSKDQGYNKFLAEMLPSRIEFKPGEHILDFSSYIYDDALAYKQDLKDDAVHAKITRGPQNPFVPDDLVAMRRQIELTCQDDNPQIYRYRFLDSSPLGSKIREGDWIVFNKDLRRVKKVVDERTIILDEEDISEPDSNGASLSDPEKHLTGIYYKNLEPSKYYLQMLGIYLHQLFFVDIGKTTKDKPFAMDIARKATALGSQFEIKSQYIPQHTTDIETIYRIITLMYLKLTLTENDDAFFAQGVNDRNRINIVLDETEALQRRIETLLQLNRRDLDRLNQVDIYQNEQNLISPTFLEKLDINKSIEESLKLRSRKQFGSLLKQFFN